jgi:cytosine permease
VDNKSNEVKLDIVDKFDEYSQEPVPIEERRPMYKPLMVWIGYAFFPSGIAAAITIGGSFPFMQSVLITFIGCLILVFISATMGVIGQTTGLHFGLIARFVWGTEGGKWAAFIPPLGLIGWGGTHISYAALFLSSAFKINYILCCIVLASLFCFIALVGFKYMTWIANLAVPSSIILLAIGAMRALEKIGGWQALLEMEPSAAGSISVVSGITLMVGTFACGTGGGSADIQRWCKTKFSAIMVSVITFGVAYVYLMACGTIISIGAGTTSVIDAFVGLGMLFSATFVLVFLTWTTCDTDYYTASLAISAATGLKRAVGVIIVPTIACILAMFHFYQYLNTFLVLMVAFIVPLMGAVTADFLVLNKCKYPDISTTKQPGLIPKWRWGAVIGLVLGAITVLLTQNVWNVGIPALQGIVVAFIGTIIFGKMIDKPLPSEEEVAAYKLKNANTTLNY